MVFHTWNEIKIAITKLWQVSHMLIYDDYYAYIIVNFNFFHLENLSAHISINIFVQSGFPEK